MSQYRVNIQKVTTIKNLVDVAWLLQLKSGDEITLEVAPSDESPLLLAAVLVCLGEEINRNHSQTPKDVDYSKFRVTTFDKLASALTQVTGFKFSISKI